VVTINTIAPDGANADAYRRDELPVIMDTIGRTVVPPEEDEDEDDDDEVDEDNDQSAD
jgi:hypothetical protein